MENDFLLEFSEILGSLENATLQQEVSEWVAFLEFARVYFKNRKVVRPIVVEVGVYNNLQKIFYERLLNAEHIGIDVVSRPNYPPADIHGDSHNLKTLEQLKGRLADRAIDLLFIDGDHSYDGVKRDYEIYGPLTKHIIALHDINTEKISQHDCIAVTDFWRELVAEDKFNTIITIQKHNTDDPHTFNPGRQMGIGLVIKGGVL